MLRELLCPTEAGLRSHDGYTAMMFAAQRGELEIVQMLVGKEKKCQNKDGATALMLGAKTDQVNVVSFLAPIENGMRDKRGVTATGYAMQCKSRADMRRAMAQYGAENAAGMTGKEKEK